MTSSTALNSNLTAKEIPAVFLFFMLTLILVLPARSQDSAAPSEYPNDEVAANVDATDLRETARDLAEIADSIRINGRDRDWDGIPIYSHNGECDQRQLDLEFAAVAPLKESISILLGTRGRPVDRDGVYWVNFDVWGQQNTDFQLGLSPSGNHRLWFFEKGEPATDIEIGGIECKISSHVTARVPIEVIRAAFVDNGFDIPDDPTGRGWVRIETLSWNHEAGEIADYGPAAASPVLDRSEFFDSSAKAIEAPEVPYASIPLPLDGGKWYVGQGAFGIWSHQDTYSYDLFLVDATMCEAEEEKAAENEKYYCWGVDVIAPVSGRVLRAHNDSTDNEPFSNSRSRPNEVYLNIDGLVALQIFHLQQGTVTVEAGETVEPGAVVGKIGNSGTSTHPHLHIDLWKLPAGKETMPIAFENVRVSLNPTLECIWARDFEIWVADEGFFVEAAAR